ncbi:MAG: hypothetical protein ACRDDW_02095 [Candidatus Rhabdochlamydia sp.]
MTISTTVSGNFHQSVCLSMKNNPNKYPQECTEKTYTIIYKCSICFEKCIKCIANTIVPYAQGCEEARRAKARSLTCICQVCEG